jgi:hypothetical protein
MMVHIHRAEERPCDGCGRRSVVCDVRGARAERGLSLCQKCFREFAQTLAEAASRIKGNLEAVANPNGEATGA